MLLNQRRVLRASLEEEGYSSVGHISVKRPSKPINIVFCHSIDRTLYGELKEGLKALAYYNLSYEVVDVDGPVECKKIFIIPFVMLNVMRYTH